MTIDELRQEMKRVEDIIENELHLLQDKIGDGAYIELEFNMYRSPIEKVYEIHLSAVTVGEGRMG